MKPSIFFLISIIATNLLPLIVKAGHTGSIMAPATPVILKYVDDIHHLWKSIILKKLRPHTAHAESTGESSTFSEMGSTVTSNETQHLKMFEDKLKRFMKLFNESSIPVDIKRKAITKFINYLDLYIMYASDNKNDISSKLALATIAAVKKQFTNNFYKLNLDRIKHKFKELQKEHRKRPKIFAGYRAKFIANPLNILLESNEELPEPVVDSEDDLYHESYTV